nr:MAG TPA: hypothetical protein [Herelleviridae sp.]
MSSSKLTEDNSCCFKVCSSNSKSLHTRIKIIHLNFLNFSIQKRAEKISTLCIFIFIFTTSGKTYESRRLNFKVSDVFQVYEPLW